MLIIIVGYWDIAIYPPNPSNWNKRVNVQTMLIILSQAKCINCVDDSYNNVTIISTSNSGRLMWRLAVRLIFIFIAIVGHDVKYYVKYFSCDGYGMIYVILSSSPKPIPPTISSCAFS